MTRPVSTDIMLDNKHVVGVDRPMYLEFIPHLSVKNAARIMTRSEFHTLFRLVPEWMMYHRFTLCQHADSKVIEPFMNAL